MNEFDQFKSEKLTLVGEQALMKLVAMNKKLQAVADAAKEATKNIEAQFIIEGDLLMTDKKEKLLEFDLWTELKQALGDLEK